MISRGVEISITGGGEEMVRDHVLVNSLFFSSYFFLFLKSCIHC